MPATSAVSADFVNPACPVNWSHPNNRGLVDWWMGLPNSGWSGGNTLRDMVRGGREPNDGVFTSSPTWTSSINGFKTINTNGSSSYVSCGTPNGLDGAALATYAAWLYKPSNSVTAGFGGCAGTSAGGARFSCNWFTDGNIYCQTENGASQYGVVALAVGLHRICVVFDGTQTGNANRLKLYVDGVLKAFSSFNGTIPATLNTVSPWLVGKDSSNRFAGGTGVKYGDIRLWTGRALSATDARVDYQQARTGFPDTLNWLGTKTYFMQNQAVPASSGLLLKRRRMMA